MLSPIPRALFEKQRPRIIVWNVPEIDMELTPDGLAALRENAMLPEALLSELITAVTR